MSLEHLAVSESKEILEFKKPTMMDYVKGLQKPIEQAPNGQSLNNLKNKIK